MSLAQFYGRVWGVMTGSAADLVYFRNQCSVGLASWLSLDPADPEGVAHLKDPKTVAAFARQWRAMRGLSPRYVFIFAHQAGLWQLPENRAADVRQMHVPLVPNADEYFKVLRSD